MWLGVRKNINQLALEHQVYYNTATGKFMWRDTIRVLGIKGGDSAEQTRPDDSRYITMGLYFSLRLLVVKLNPPLIHPV
jgi:hypothetical protein